MGRNTRRLKVGHHVIVNWRKPGSWAPARQTEVWHEATVIRVNADGSVAVHFKHGAQEKDMRVPRKHVMACT